jgi:prepilin-type N-terminal cleavage/methylation domain-containing protein
MRTKDESRKQVQESRQGGFTLLEVTVSMAVLSVAFLALAQGLERTSRVRSTEREAVVAFQVAEHVMAEVEGTPFDQLWRRYNDDPSDDPASGAAAPGSVRALDDLTVAGEELSIPLGLLEEGTVTVRLPMTGSGPTAVLSELAQDEPLGCPRDLNGDGLLSPGSRAADHVLLPVEVVVQWGRSNPRQRVSLRTVRANL